MGFWHDVYAIRKRLEHEYKFAGHYGKKGEKRGKREKPTPEQMELYNRIYKTKYIRRTIGINYEEGDLWVTLTYKNKTVKNIGQIKKDAEKFIDRMRYRYRRMGKELKWMLVIEIGKRGGIHAHILINRVTDADAWAVECWPHGHPYFKPIYEDGGYGQLASYMSKLPEEEDGSGKSKIERMQKLTKENYYFSTSRNLVRPEPEEHKRYFRRTVERIIRDGPKPRPGYYIEQDSIRTGVNRVTGMSYLYYTECRIEGYQRE